MGFELGVNRSTLKGYGFRSRERLKVKGFSFRISALRYGPKGIGVWGIIFQGSGCGISGLWGVYRGFIGGLKGVYRGFIGG